MEARCPVVLEVQKKGVVNVHLDVSLSFWLSFKHTNKTENHTLSCLSQLAKANRPGMTLGSGQGPSDEDLGCFTSGNKTALWGRKDTKVQNHKSPLSFALDHLKTIVATYPAFSPCLTTGFLANMT